MRLVITGATSFVGGATVHEALRRGHQIAAVVRPGSKKLEVITKDNGQALLEGRLLILENDLSEPEMLPEKIRKILLEKSREKSLGSFDVFCHFGWGGSGSGSRSDKELQEENLQNSLRTVRAAKELGCKRFLFSGSQAEYGMHQELMTEEVSCSPRSIYGEAKLKMCSEGEKLCKELGLLYIHARIFSAYGPGDHPWTLVESCLDAFLGGAEISLGECTQQWNFLHIRDLARAMCALAETKEEHFSGFANPVFNLAGNETRPLREFVEEIYELCGRNGSFHYGIRPENAEGPVNLIPDIGKLCKATGWSPQVDFRTGIGQLVEMRRKSP